MRLGYRATIYMTIASVALLAAALAHEPQEAGAGRAATGEASTEDQQSPAASRCPASTWPYVTAACTSNAEETAPSAIRIIEVDRSNQTHP